LAKAPLKSAFRRVESIECVEELYDPPLTPVTPTELNTGSCTDTAPPGSVPVRLTVTTRVPLDVELKDLDVEADALEVFRHAGWTPREFVVTSFDAGTLERVRRTWPDLAIGLLTDDDFGAAVARAAAIETDFLEPHHSTIDLDAVSERSVAGLPLVAWTVNDPLRLRALLSHSAIAGVITDAVAVARDARSAGSHHRT